jgi:hypothetical protein
MEFNFKKITIMKKENAKPRFADNDLDQTINCLDYLNKKNDKDMHVLPKFAKLTFYNKQIHYKPGSTKGVACTMHCVLHFDLPDFLNCEMLNNFYEGGQHFNVTGVSHCADEDPFDLNKGILIAQAKAENEGYRVAREMCKVAMKTLDNVVKAFKRSIPDFDRYIGHNKDFIEKIADNKINVKTRRI